MTTHMLFLTQYTKQKSHGWALGMKNEDHAKHRMRSLRIVIRISVKTRRFLSQYLQPQTSRLD